MPMSRKQRLALGAQRRAAPQATPIPIGGWNTRDTLASMDPGDAIVLDNWFPDAGGATLRKGYITWSTGIGSGAVPTLAEYNAGNTRKLIAAGGGAFYDASAGGPVGAALASGFGRDWWNSIAFNSRLFFFNGLDTPQVYNGATMSAQTFTGPGSLVNLLGGTAFQNRLYLVERNRTGFWFGPLSGVTGALSFFDLSMLSELGGNLAAITSFSYDGGSGVFDFIAFVMTSGEVFVYQGNDPSNASNFALVGRYRLAAPVNMRSVLRYGGDSFITTSDDHIALQQGFVALRTGTLPPRTKASGAVEAAVAANGSADGFQALYYRRGHRLIFNIPNPDGTFDQHVNNVSNDAWCRFRGMPAATWGLFNENLYFGASSGGIVYQADTGFVDNGIQAIVGRGQQAWNTFGSAERKHITAIRPLIQSVGGVNYSFGIGFDYGDIAVPLMSSSAPQGSPWDTSPWDLSPWSPDSQIDPRWRVGGGSGVAVSWALQVSAMTAVTWERTDAWYEPGQGL